MFVGCVCVHVLTHTLRVLVDKSQFLTDPLFMSVAGETPSRVLNADFIKPDTRPVMAGRNHMLVLEGTPLAHTLLDPNNQAALRATFPDWDPRDMTLVQDALSPSRRYRSVPSNVVQEAIALYTTSHKNLVDMINFRVSRRVYTHRHSHALILSLLGRTTV